MRSLSICEIDVHIEVLRVEYEKLTDYRLGEPSADVCTRVVKAREAQRNRFAGSRDGTVGNVPLLCNAEMPALQVQARVWAQPRCGSTAG